MEKSQSGGPKKFGGCGRQTPPDFSRKVKKKKKISNQQSGIAKSGLWKKIVKKGK
jgi:hypothetical protein